MQKVLLLSFLFLTTQILQAQKNDNSPNFIFILADDQGWNGTSVKMIEDNEFSKSDFYETPNIERIASKGVIFSNAYASAPVCAPSRSVFLSGQHTGYTPIRGNDEWTERGDTWNYQAMFNDPSLEGQRPIPDSTITIAEVLKTAGYTTGMVGKWGLGAPLTLGLPNNQGFDFFYEIILQTF